MDVPTRALKARYVFPVDAPPIEDGIVTIRGEIIISVGRETSADQIEDLGNVALLPSLANAHTHLEFSDLAAPLGTPGMALPDWIRQVIEYRADNSRDISAAVQAGLAESASSGTAMLGEITSTAVPMESYHRIHHAPRDAAFPHAEREGYSGSLTIFHELIGLSAKRGAAALAAVKQRMEAGCETACMTDLRVRRKPTHASDGLGGPSYKVTHGLSPHAPYSIHPDIVAACGVQQTLPVAMHLAESREELELLACGTGPFVELLTDLGAWDAAAIPRGTRPLDYLKRLAACDRSLVIHGNYLDDEEIQFLAANCVRMTLVYCPRTHAYFNHAPYPLAKLLTAGVRVALGTDSRASNPDLNLFAEMRHIAQTHPDVLPPDILAMGTINGAVALGCDDSFGTLTPGKRASIYSVPLTNGQHGDPYELLFREAQIDTYRE